MGEQFCVGSILLLLYFSSCTDFSIGFVTFKSVASAELALSASEQELCLDARYSTSLLNWCSWLNKLS